MAVFNTTPTTSGDYMALPLSIKRGNPKPLDPTDFYESYDAAAAYAKSDPTAYVGQVITVAQQEIAEGTNDITYQVNLYQIVDPNGTLLPITGGEDGASIETIEQAESEDDPSVNIMTVTLTDGKEFEFTVKNGKDGQDGEKGEKGDQGEKGDPGEDGLSNLTEAITPNIDVGGIKSGITLEAGTNIMDVLKTMLVRHIAPAVSMSLTPNTTLYENGKSIESLTIKANITIGSKPVNKVEFYVGGTKVNESTDVVSKSGSVSYTHTTPITTTTSISVKIYDEINTVASASSTITFVAPSYYGTVGASVTSMDAAAIKSLNKTVKTSKSYTYSNINMDYGKIVYAYPTSFGALSSIKDANNVDYTNSYSRTTVTVDGVQYYVYLLKDAAGVSSFRQTFA